MSQDHHLDTSIFGEPAPVEPRRRRRQRRRRGKGRTILTLLIAVLLVGAAAATAYSFLGPVISAISGGGSGETDYPGPGQGEVAVTIKQGDTGETIATTLRDLGVVRTRTAYLEAVSADPELSAKIQPGTYALKKSMRATDAFAMLADPANRTVPRVTLPEGLWVSEIIPRLSKATGVPAKDYTAAMKNPEKLGLPAEAKGRFEGYLFPSTYEFDTKTSAAEQLTQMVAKTVAELTKAGVPPKDYTRILTVASIIEGEVSGDADRAKVARVIENRLDDPKGPTVGRLQMDSTIHFIAQERGRAGTTEKQRAADSPYNTYRNAGLPPGPINNPGAASIEAAASPADGPWFYFVAVNPETGETKFAVTQAEHDRNVQEFNAWCRDHPGTC